MNFRGAEILVINGDPEGAAAVFGQALDISRRAESRDPVAEIDALLKRSLAYSLRHRVRLAMADLDEAHALMSRIPTSDSNAPELLLNIADALLSSGAVAEAAAAANQGVERIVSGERSLPGDLDTFERLQRLGVVLAKANRPKEADRSYRLALEVAEKVRKNWTSKLFEILGELHLFADDPFLFRDAILFPLATLHLVSGDSQSAAGWARQVSGAASAGPEAMTSWALAAKLIIAEAVRPANPTDAARLTEEAAEGSRRLSDEQFGVGWTVSALGNIALAPETAARGATLGENLLAILEHIAPENAPGRLQVTSRVADLQMAAGNLDRAAVLLRHLLDRMPPRDFVAADDRAAALPPACGTG